MPALTPNDRQIAQRTVRACIASNMELYYLDNKSVSLKLGISERTFRENRKSPESFTMPQLWDISKALKLTPIQAASIVLGRPLTKKEIKDFILL